MGRRSKFSGIEDPAGRKRAMALLHSYNVQIAAYQRSWDGRATAPGVGLYHLKGLELKDYIGFSDSELASYPSFETFKFAVESRRAIIKKKIENQLARVQANAMYGGHGEGLNQAELLAMAVMYNHGEGALFYGYADSFADEDPTNIEDWYI